MKTIGAYKKIGTEAEIKDLGVLTAARGNSTMHQPLQAKTLVGSWRRCATKGRSRRRGLTFVLVWLTGGWPQSRRPVSHNSEPPVSDQPPPVGSIHQGAVHTVKHFGIFVSIPGYRRHVLVHHTQVGAQPACSISFAGSSSHILLF